MRQHPRFFVRSIFLSYPLDVQRGGFQSSDPRVNIVVGRAVDNRKMAFAHVASAPLLLEVDLDTNSLILFYTNASALDVTLDLIRRLDRP